jgi:hypothetical protein
MAALREKLITVEQIKKMPRTTLYEVLCRRGISALRAGLLTSQQIVDKPYLALLLGDTAMTAMQEGLFSSSDAGSLPTVHHLLYLLSDCGLMALRNGNLTIQELAATGDAKGLSQFLHGRKRQRPTDS